MDTTFQIEICRDDLLLPNYVENITDALSFVTGFEPMELDFLNGARNDCWILDFTPNRLYLRHDPIDPDGECEIIQANYPFCGNEHTITIQININDCTNNDPVETNRKFGSFIINDLHNAHDFTGYIVSANRTEYSANPANVMYRVLFSEPFETIEYSPIININALSPSPNNPTIVHAIENVTVNGFDLLLREFANEVQNVSVVIEIV